MVWFSSWELSLGRISCSFISYFWNSKNIFMHEKMTIICIMWSSPFSLYFVEVWIFVLSNWIMSYTCIYIINNLFVWTNPCSNRIEKQFYKLWQPKCPRIQYYILPLIPMVFDEIHDIRVCTWTFASCFFKSCFRFQHVNKFLNKISPIHINPPSLHHYNSPHIIVLTAQFKC